MNTPGNGTKRPLADSTTLSPSTTASRIMESGEQFAVVFRRYSATEARQLAATVEEVYRKSYVNAIASGNIFNTPDAFMARFSNYCSQPGMDLVIAYRDHEAIGQTWGWPLNRDSRWWDGLKEAPEAGFTDEDGGRTFALSEIMVAEKWAGKGIARALHDALLAGRPEQRATLLVRPGNPARHAYERWGWTKAGELQPHLEGAPVFAVMIKNLDNSRGH